ncbi:MAG: TldD/PmbA family protein [Promethearchaeota archaeon]
MQNKPDFYNLSNFALKFAEKNNSNLKCADIYFGKNKFISIEIEENSVKNSEIGSSLGASIRAIDKRGSLGFAYTNNLEKKSMEKMISNALGMMNAGTGDSDFKNLPDSYEKYPSVNDLFDIKLKIIEIEESLGYAKDLIDVCKEDELAISQSAEFTSSYSKVFVFNSNGIEVSGKVTSCSVSSNIIVKDKVSKETSFGFDWQSSRNLNNINATEIAKNALEKAKKNLNRIKVKNMKVPLILTPNGTISFILNPLASAINAETFQYKRSFLIGKRNEIIAAEHLNIEDNALIDGALGSSPFDAEGVPCKNKKIVERGKFLQDGLLHNSYTAGKEGIESTGNAVRSSYSSVPSIGISNFIMKPGDFTQEEIISDVKKGIILEYTGDSPNITTGDFSGLILQGNLIENGEIKEPLNETMFGINLFDLFKNLDAVSKQYKTYGRYKAPYVKIKDVQIIGAAN